MNWKIVQLQQIASEEKGSIVSGPFGSNISAKYFVDEGVPVIRGNNLTKGGQKFIDDGYVFLTESKAAEFRNCIALKDDIVFTAAGSIGQVGIIPHDTKFEKYVISNKQLRVRIDKKKADPMFVYYWLSCPQMVSYLVSMNNGGAVPLLNLGIIRRVPVPLPPLDIQVSISAIVSNFNDAVENNLKRIQLLEESARLLFREWFVYFRFPLRLRSGQAGHEKVKIIDGVPEGWEEKTLGDIFEIKKGKNITKDTTIEGRIPVVAGGLTPAYYHNKPNVSGPVITISASGANSGYVNLYHEDIWASDCSYINSDSTPLMYYYYLLLKTRQKEITGLQRGAAQPHVYPKDIMNLKVSFLPNEITNSFENKVTPVFNLIKNLTIQNQKLAQARDLLLPRLMSGTIQV